MSVSDATKDMFSFLIEKCKTAQTPFVISELSKEYKSEMKSGFLLSQIISRINKCRLLVNTMDNIDFETRVRMLFALSIPVEDAVLAELKEYGEVVLDDQRRLIKFQCTKIPGLALDGVHIDKKKQGVVTEDNIVLTPRARRASKPYQHNVESPDLQNNRAKLLRDKAKKKTMKAAAHLLSTAQAAPEMFKAVQQIISAVQVPDAVQVMGNTPEDDDVVVIEPEPQQEETQIGPEQKPNIELLNSSVVSSTPTITMDKHIQILEAVDNMITVLKLSIDENVLENLRKYIQNKYIEKSIEVKELETALKGAFSLATKSEVGQGRPLSRFILLFSSLVTSLKMPELDNLKKELEECDTRLMDREQMVSVDRLQFAVHVLIDLLTP